MTPIVPFKPTAQNAFPSLRQHYSDHAIRAFVEKLRQLADVSPDHCEQYLQALDGVLAGILDHLTPTMEEFQTRAAAKLVDRITDDHLASRRPKGGA